jgi:TonB family protein
VWRAWLLASLACIALLMHAVIRMSLMRREWRESDTEIGRVLVANDTGPAVVGVLQPRIVVPAWSLEADRSTRELLLRHELEHLNAGDSRVLFGAAVLLALFPWNAALGWMARRLRLTIEIDCDARVLRALGRRREYGLMLLSVSERHATPLPNAAGLAEPGSHLEARIDAMTTLTRSRPLASSIPFAAIAIVVLTTAAWTPRPAPIALPIRHLATTATSPHVTATSVTPLAIPPGEPMSPAGSRVLPRVSGMPPVRFTPTTFADLHITEASLPTRADPKPLPGNPPPRYPQRLLESGTEGYVTLRFATDSRGVADSATIQIIESTDSAFTDAVRAVVPRWRFDSGGMARMACVFRRAEPTSNASRLTNVPSDSVYTYVMVDGQAVRPMIITAARRRPDTAILNTPFILVGQTTPSSTASQDTRVRRLFTEFLAAVNSGDRRQISAYIDKYSPYSRKEETVSSLYEHGAVELLRITRSDSLSLEFVALDKPTARTEVGYFALAPGGADQLQSLRVLYVPPGRTAEDTALLEHLRAMRP